MKGGRKNWDEHETTTTNDTPQEGRNNRRTLLITGGKLGCRPRAEWPGVRAVIGGEPLFEAQGAGHPHWQFDALRSIQLNAEAELERGGVESVVADTTPVEDFAIERTPSNRAQILTDLAEFRWTRMHFASLG